MKNLLRRIVLCWGMLLPVAAMALPQAQLIERGKCGDNVEWYFYAIPGTELEDYITIEGVGAMYDNMQVKPWAKYVDRITYVSIKGGITHVGSYAFKDHKNLRGVYMWSSVKSIGDHAFENCAALKRATISDVAEVGDHAFDCCTSLSVLESNTKMPAKIGHRAFAETALTSVNLSKVEQWANAAFYNCQQLSSLTLPEKLTVIPSSSFRNSRKLKSVIIPSGVTSIGREAFSGSGLESVTIPASVTSIRIGAFGDCAMLKSVTFEGTILPEFTYSDVFGSNAEGRKLYIKPGTQLDSKYSYSYSRDFVTSGTCSSNISFSLENGTLTFTGSGAIPDYDDTGKRPWDGFKYAIDKVVIAEGITSVGKNVCAGMTIVKNVSLPTSLTSIGTSAFQGCKGLGSITFPQSLQAIGDHAFDGCTVLSSDKSIPASVTSIGANAFSGCYEYYNIVFEGTTLPALGNDAFNEHTKCPLLFNVPVGYTFIDESTWTDDYKERFKVNGKCGTDAIFTYTVKEARLSIIGTGAVDDYADNTQPWASFKKDIARIVVGYGITSIGSHAFSGFSAMTTVNVLGDVKTIGDHAFYNCSSLNTITNITHVETIGDYAFAGCTALTWIDIAKSVNSIGEGAFKNCSNLASVTFDSNVLPELGTNAFDNNASDRSFYADEGFTYKNEGTWTDAYKSAIVVSGYNYTYNYNIGTKTLKISGKGPMADYTTLNMPWSAHKDAEHLVIEGDIESVGNYAFYDFTKLKDVVLPTTIRSIGTAAFGYCRALTSVTLSEDLQIIGENAFIGSEALAEVTIPSLVTVIGKGAFEGCSQLVRVDFESVVLPTLGGNAFAQNNSQRKFYVKTGYGFTDESTWTDAYKEAFMVKTNTGVIYHYDAATKTLTFSGTGVIEDYSTDSQPWSNYSSDIEKVVIEAGITKVGDYTLWLCENLTSVTIPSTVTRIGMSAFAYCSKLPSVTLPEGLTSIDFGAFHHCDALTEVTIPSSVIEINGQAFGACPALAKVTFESTTLPALTGSNAFDGDAINRRFYVKGGYTFIDESTWTDDYKNVFMEKTSTDVCFNYDEKYRVLTIGGEGAMADYAYRDDLPWKACWDKVEEIIVEEGVTSIGKNAFYGFENLTYVSIEGGVTSIGENAFAQCRAMLDITLPETLTTIGDRAFNGCENLSEITLPSNVANIGYNAFWYCPGITDVYCNADPSSLTWKVSTEGDESFMADKATICHVLLGTISSWTEKFSNVNVTFLADQRNGMTGTGTEADPYMLVSADDVRWMATKFNSAVEAERASVEGKYFKLVSDIDFNGMEESNYTPIKSFKGHFDGDGYAIYGVNVSVEGDNNAALIDKLEDGSSVKNIVLDYSTFSGAVAAPIVCQMYGTATVENCHVTKDVTVTSTQSRRSAGGIVAYMHSGTPVVKDCSSQAMVTSTDAEAGGIVGFFAAGTVDNCMYLDYNIHVNEKRYKKGAIAGYYGNGTATNCYYTSTDMTDKQGALMPDAEVDNTAFLAKLHERDEYMMNAGMPKELIGYDITLNNHILSSSLDSRKAYVVCLPFDMKITDVYGETDEISVYDMLKVDIDNNEFVFTNEFPILSAGKPYIVVVKAGTMMLTGKNVLVTATPEEGRAVNETETESPAGLWQGTFKKMDNTELLNEKAYILQKDGVFRRTTQKNTGCYVDAFTGYFAATENLTSKKFKVRFQRTENGVTEGDVTDFPADEFDYGFDLGDDETGVKEIHSTQYTVHSSDSFYTLDGRKISGKPANKGIYISNGIKVVE